jgi:hypothetical protein
MKKVLYFKNTKKVTGKERDESLINKKRNIKRVFFKERRFVGREFI